MGTYHRRHTGELNPIFNDVVNLAICEVLRGGEVKIRYAGVLIRADRSSSPGIDSMAGSAARQEVLAALLDSQGIARLRILLTSLPPRNCEIAYRSGGDSFKSRGCGRGTEPTPFEHTCADCPGEQQSKKSDDQCFSRFHLCGLAG